MTESPRSKNTRSYSTLTPFAPKETNARQTRNSKEATRKAYNQKSDKEKGKRKYSKADSQTVRKRQGKHTKREM